MKRLLALCLIACLVLTLGCLGGKKSETTPTNNDSLNIDLPEDNTTTDSLDEIDTGVEEIDLQTEEDDVDFGGVI